MSNQILLYHGITKYKNHGIENYSNKHLNYKVFEKQIKFLTKYKNVVPLKKIQSSKNSIAITFDDSYKNISQVAYPILKKYKCPATFFVNTGFINTKKKYWTDKLEIYFNNTSVNKIDLSKFKKSLIGEINNKKKKIFFIKKVKNFLKENLPKKRDEILKDIKFQLKPKLNLKKIYNYQNLSLDDLKKMHKPPNYEVGGHTVNHEILSYLDQKNLDLEIKNCIKYLRQKIDKSINVFSYPEGKKNHFNLKVIKKLKKYKIIICPSAIYGCITKNQNSFHLKRKMVGFNNLKFPFKIK